MAMALRHFAHTSPNVASIFLLTYRLPKFDMGRPQLLRNRGYKIALLEITVGQKHCLCVCVLTRVAQIITAARGDL